MESLNRGNILGLVSQKERDVVVCLFQGPSVVPNACILFVDHVPWILIWNWTKGLQLFQKYLLNVKFCRQILNDSLRDINSKDCRPGAGVQSVYSQPCINI